jgi:hypothetical protein
MLRQWHVGLRGDKSEKILAISQGLKPQIVLGNRIYQNMDWKRKDTILLASNIIGYIHVSCEDRIGMTVSTSQGLTKKGRAIDWCVKLALLSTSTTYNKEQHYERAFTLYPDRDDGGTNRLRAR